MALTNPRTAVGWDEANAEWLPFAIDGVTITYDGTLVGGAAGVGLAVTMSGNGIVALAADGDIVKGKLISVESDGKCRVQTGGACTLPAGASATVTAGLPIVGALGASSAKGYIRNAAAAGASPTQTEVNEARKGRHSILDASTTTAVWVDLD